MYGVPKRYLLEMSLLSDLDLRETRKVIDRVDRKDLMDSERPTEQ